MCARGRVTTQLRPVRPAKATGPTGAARLAPTARVGHPHSMCRVSGVAAVILVLRVLIPDLTAGLIPSSCRVLLPFFFLLQRDGHVLALNLKD